MSAPTSVCIIQQKVKGLCLPASLVRCEEFHVDNAFDEGAAVMMELAILPLYVLHLLFASLWFVLSGRTTVSSLRRGEVRRGSGRRRSGWDRGAGTGQVVIGNERQELRTLYVLGAQMI